MDKKSTIHKTKNRKRGKIPRSLRTNEMIYKTSWTVGLLTASTAGAISSSTLGFTIQNSTEYSSLITLFGECKLVSAKLAFSPRGANSLTNISRVMLGYHVEYNSTTFTNPTQFSSVSNLPHRATIPSNIIKTFVYRVPVPRNLDYTAINADCPTLPTPFAGSPGTVMVYGTNFQASADYYIVDALDVVYHLRYRV